MELKDRIESIKQYFVTCNIGEGAVCVVVKFPKGWVIPETNVLMETYKTVAQPKNGVYFFMTEIVNGEGTVFSAIENVIQSNKELESKRELLKAKAQELTELFTNEPLDKLKTLTFVFDTKSGKVRKATKVKTTPEVVKEEKYPHVVTVDEVEENNNLNMNDVETIIGEAEKYNEESEIVDNEVSNSSLMDLAVSLVS